MMGGNHKIQTNFLFVIALLALWLRAADANALVSNLKSFTAGGVGGVLSVLVGHPL